MDSKLARIPFFALALSLSMTNSAFSDYKENEEYRWSRIYIGTHLNNNHYKSNVKTSSNPGSYFINEDYPQLAEAGSDSKTGSDISGGINIGWNYQWNDFIFGIEADYLDNRKQLKMDSGDVTYITQPAHTFKTTGKINIEHTISLRPKFGYTWNDSLLYVTGGLSFAKLNYSFDFSETFQNQLSSVKKSNTQKGWTFGAGIEHPLNTDWTVRVEYLYSEFETLSASSQLSDYPDQIIDNKVKVKMSDFRIGINYHF